MRANVAVLAEVLLGSPWKLLFFIIKKYVYRIKVSKKKNTTDFEKNFTDARQLICALLNFSPPWHCPCGHRHSTSQSSCPLQTLFTRTNCQIIWRKLKYHWQGACVKETSCSTISTGKSRRMLGFMFRHLYQLFKFVFVCTSSVPVNPILFAILPGKDSSWTISVLAWCSHQHWQAKCEAPWYSGSCALSSHLNPDQS